MRRKGRCAAMTTVAQRGRGALTKTVFWMVSERSVKLLCGGVMAILMARYFSPENYGKWGVAMALASFGRDFVGLGLDQLVLRDLAKEGADRGRILGSYAGLMAMVSVGLGVILMGVGVYNLHDFESRNLVMILVWLAVPQAMMPADLWLLSRYEAKRLVLTRNVVSLVLFAVRGLMMWKQVSLVPFAWLLLGETVLYYGVGWGLYLAKRDITEKLGWCWRQMGRWLVEAWPIFTTMFLNSVAYSAQTLLVQKLTTWEATGQYAAATKLAEQWWLIIGAGAGAVLPRLVQAKEEGPDAFRQLLQAVLDLAVAASVLVGIVSLGVLPWLIPLALGDSYQAAVAPLLILIWVAPASFCDFILFQFLAVEGKLAYGVPLALANAVIQLAVSILLIRYWGEMGAATAIFVAAWVSTFWVPFWFAATREYARWQVRSLYFFLHLRSTVAFVRRMWSNLRH